MFCSPTLAAVPIGSLSGSVSTSPFSRVSRSAATLVSKRDALGLRNWRWSHHASLQDVASRTRIASGGSALPDGISSP